MRSLATNAHQLRLALVLNGGVSLAVYMYGVTKELHSLAVASAALDLDRAAGADSGGRQPQPASHRPTGTSGVYYDLLQKVSTPGAPVSVVIDLIAGTSAGGINGVILAKGLAGALSVDPLERVWFDKGDVGRLILPDLETGGRFHRLLGAVSNGFRPVAALGNGLLDLVADRAPLHSNNMSRWVIEALIEMDELPHVLGQDTLVPDGESLELQVTATDLMGYAREISDDIVGELPADPTFRQVFRFTHGAGEPAGETYLALVDRPDLVPACGGNGPLAFSARATSSFPGAFPPITIAGFATEVNAKRSSAVFDPEVFAQAGFPAYRAAGIDPLERQFIDGGVLDNTPFDLVIKSIAAKEAASQVTRHIVYVQPAPNPDPLAKNTDENDQRKIRRMGIVGTLHHALLTIPRSTSMLTALLNLQQINVGIETVGKMLATLDASATPATESSSGDGVYDELRALDERRDVIAAVCRRLAIPDDSNPAIELTLALTALDFGHCEFAFRRRRLQVSIQQVNQELLAATDIAARRALAAIKQRLYTLLRELKDALDDGLTTLPTAMVAGSPRIAGADIPAATWEALRREAEAASGALADVDVTRQRILGAEGDAGAGPEWATRVMKRFDNFPAYDRTTLPLTALADIPQLNPIRATRMSPLDATMLNARHLLAGLRLGHFAGFFHRKWRKEDYLWGRLTSAEQVVRLVAAAVDDPAPDVEVEVESFVRRAIGQVLESEAAVVSSLNSPDIAAAQALADPAPTDPPQLSADGRR